MKACSLRFFDCWRDYTNWWCFATRFASIWLELCQNGGYVHRSMVGRTNWVEVSLIKWLCVWISLDLCWFGCFMCWSIEFLAIWWVVSDGWLGCEIRKYFHLCRTQTLTNVYSFGTFSILKKKIFSSKTFSTEKHFIMKQIKPKFLFHTLHILFFLCSLFKIFKWIILCFLLFCESEDNVVMWIWVMKIFIKIVYKIFK